MIGARVAAASAGSSMPLMFLDGGASASFGIAARRLRRWWGLTHHFDVARCW